MWEKLKIKLLEGVLISKVIKKGAQAVAGIIVGLLAAPFFVDKVQPILATLGIVLDKEKIQAGLIVIITGLIASLWNYIKHRFFKTDDPVVLDKAA